MRRTSTATTESSHGHRGIPPRYYDWLSRIAGVGEAQWQLVAQAGISPRATVLEIGDASALPCPDESVDRVLSSFVLHHVPDDRKVVALREARRVLRPGGRLHVLDFAPDGQRWTSRGPRSGDRGPGQDSALLQAMADAELVDIACIGAGASLLGRRRCYRASR